jgi:hypothetical protein
MRMPSSSLLLTLLPVMVLLFEFTLIPASLCDHILPEFVTVNPSSVIPATVNVIALPFLLASTTG